MSSKIVGWTNNVTIDYINENITYLRGLEESKILNQEFINKIDEVITFLASYKFHLVKTNRPIREKNNGCM